MAVRKIEHVGIMVSNLENSIAFYEKVIGLTLKGTLTHTNGVMRLAFLGFNESAETELELIEGYNDGLPVEGKVHHIAFTVDHVEAEFARIQALDVKLIDNEITTLPNGSRYFFFHGPDGEWIEMFESTRRNG
ncbi:VOC family protein [Paenibacillus doosanensis]|uniref:Lactoylglutathione lyase n=1 Tax=Paenibacillus konkukensis TaxID=2020716 RepID=A0ABY4RZX1_9BACL|nr:MULTISPECIES: VOC family protein [Paenibacillus]MCS7459338.1 VOC family protein [Paenibacillus doosanensis]UQZ87131.1 Lactoylglutathione lyase [Paenibacillus konkukensis]